MKPYLTAFLLIALFAATASANEIEYCMSATAANEALQEGTLHGKNFYEESHGARVQREHPKTYMFGQIKYFPTSSGITCQYSNHVGLVFTQFHQNIEILAENKCPSVACSDHPFWREEWIESSPDLDKPGRDKLHVCIEEREGKQHPSIGCGVREILDNSELQ